jgi:hypothetical protein
MQAIPKTETVQVVSDLTGVVNEIQSMKLKEAKQILAVDDIPDEIKASKSMPRQLTKKPSLAIDAGGVLFLKTERSEPSEPMEGAKEGLIALRKLGFELILVSFCGRKKAIQTKEDINLHFQGLLDKQYYNKNRLEKSAICQYLGVEALIDDTKEILDVFETGLYHGKKDKEIAPTTIRPILFGEPKQIPKKDTMLWVPDWEHVVRVCSSLLEPCQIPNPQINLAAYVYGDLCVPAI